MKQTIVDRYVDDLACTLGISRSQLNVTAAAKGLVAGNFKILRQEGHVVDGLNETEGLLVPKISEHDVLDLTAIRWILVIEKEATFRSLLSTALWRRLGSHGLVLTAKGYPDLASRKFLGHVTDQVPNVPVLAFVDLDPDGIAILSTYKYGSYRLAHEEVKQGDAPGLGLPHIRWLGVRRHQVSRTPVGESGRDTSVGIHLQGLMKLTARDRTKAVRMLEWDTCADDGPEPDWRHELQTMLVLNSKAEMQVLDELPGGLVWWLDRELREACQHSMSAATADPCSDDGMLY
ncbi:Spo11/DNA topoisomerase VI subunit A [Phaeosphaeria sp. MPI-PUGE-AT-0046c]|nr:Spo11/DNA topoisomerase VI subunit A [Phaeosphaeria sp. MPI-PUGE-AT-0046c]